MTADAVGAILVGCVMLYAILAGADFGGGLWDLVGGGEARGREPRRLIETSITPVWETNHVWLVICLVIFWTAFPFAFAPVMIVLALPLWLALAGIVLRGAGFAFRKEITRPELVVTAGAVFALSSFATPFFMGVVVGAIATGAVPADATQGSVAAWTSATALLAGFVFVAACAYLAAVYLAGEAARRDDGKLVTYFSRRAMVAGVVAGALSLAALGELHSSNAVLYGRLTGRALPLVVIAGVCGLATIGLLVAGTVMVARVVAALGVACVIWGWGVAQFPVLLPKTPLTLYNAGAPEATLVAVIVVAVLIAVLVVPSIALLFSLQGRQMLEGGAGQGHGSPTDGPSPAGSATVRRGGIGDVASSASDFASSARHPGRGPGQ